jgi:YihY family inner membrane protein
MDLMNGLSRFDRRQQEVKGVRFVVAVYKKFLDDQASQLGALIAYYAFVSLFPLLLVLVTVLGFVLQGNPAEKERILRGALGRVPLISDSIHIQGLQGSTPALIIGVVFALLAGVGITNASQNAFNRIWGVPFKRRPNFFAQRLRSLGMLLLLGALTIVSATAAGFVGASDHSTGAVVASELIAVLSNLVVFTLAFKLLTAKELTLRDVIVGVVVATILIQGLQHLGGLYLAHTLERTTPLYGAFAVVLGLLAWFYIAAQLVLFSAEFNVVSRNRLWPRSLFEENVGRTDERALRIAARTEERLHSEHVTVDFEDPPPREE